MLRKILPFFIIAAVILAAAQPAGAKPRQYPFDGMQLDRENPYPDKPPFYTEPYAPTYEERVRAALEWTAENRGGWDGGMARVILGGSESLDEDTVQYFERRLGERNDCADFTTIRLTNTLYLHKQKPFLTDDHYERLKRAALGFKYWYDQPGPDKMIFWTENHQILFNANEYLMGQMFPDEIFSNTGRNGRWHMEHARPRVMDWLERRARWGFSEWDSNVYYTEDLGAVLNLAQYAGDPVVARAAAIVADLMFFDMFVDVHHGVYGTSHGRSYAKDVMTGRDDSTSDIITMITGIGQFGGSGGMDSTALASSDRYRPSQVIIDIGQHDPAELVSRERHGIPLEQITGYGLSFKRKRDLTTLMGMGIYTQPQVLDMFLKAADRYHWWDQPFLDEVGDAHKAIPRNGTAGKFRENMEVESDRTLLGEVNKVTYRTHDYMLSSALDYRPGERGNQHHIWQATLSPEAVVFTTNPGSLKLHTRTPCYWGGQNRLPRVAQHKNLAVILYDINMEKALGERDVYDFVHAFFPKWAFDETHEKDNWIIARRKDAYIALYSALPYQWKDPESEWAHDAVAKGKRHIWICQMGSRAQYGSFGEFMESVLEARLAVDVDALTVEYDAPGVGTAKFAWTGPFTIDGRQIPLDGFKRVESPYCASEFDTGVYVIEHNGRRLTLDMKRFVRKEEAVAD